MSTHAVNIISIDNLNPHPNADKLQLSLIGGWQCVIGKDVKLGDKMVYIEPDYVVPTDHPSFAFLKSNVIGAKPTKRITVRRFRGEISQGLLVPVPSELADLPVGTNVIEQLGITRYEPPEEVSMGGNIKSGPSLQYAPKFDVESYQRYTDHISENEEVIATEKIHGCFKNDTKVKLINGEEINISDIKIGDIVISYDLITETFEQDIVIDVIKQNLDKKWINLSFDNGRNITCTIDHKFLTKNRGWVEANNLKDSDEIVEG